MKTNRLREFFAAEEKAALDKLIQTETAPETPISADAESSAAATEEGADEHEAQKPNAQFPGDQTPGGGFVVFPGAIVLGFRPDQQQQFQNLYQLAFEMAQLQVQRNRERFDAMLDGIDLGFEDDAAEEPTDAFTYEDDGDYRNY